LLNSGIKPLYIGRSLKEHGICEYDIIQKCRPTAVFFWKIAICSIMPLGTWYILTVQLRPH